MNSIMLYRVLFVGILSALMLINRKQIAFKISTSTNVSPIEQTSGTVVSLVPPYFGPREINSYFDHEYPNYSINDRIVLWDGQTARREYGECGWRANDGRAIAYFDRPAGQPNRNCIWYEGHPGYDFALIYEPVLAATDGIVIRAGWEDWNRRGVGLGLRIYITHANGLETRYGHLSALVVLTNTWVYEGQIIGTSGNTGNSSGPHLHFEVRLNNLPIDPFGGSGSFWLWKEGRWDDQGRWVGRSIPASTSYLVIDDVPPSISDPFFRKGHTVDGILVSCPPASCPHWYPETGIGWNSDMIWTYSNDQNRDYWALWEPSKHGIYEIRVFIPRKYATTWWARYWLVTSSTYQPAIYMVVDQYGVSDRWISLGIHRFGPYPGWAALWIDDATLEQPTIDQHCGAGWCQIGVDAVKFVTAWPVYIPVALNQGQ